MRKRPVRIAILSNEFFDETLGRSGGFGWAAREAANCLRRNLGEAVSIDFLHAAPPASLSGPFAAVSSDGFTVRSAIRSRSSRLRALLIRAPDLIITVDYRPSFASTLAFHHRIPTIVWARDPRTPDDWRRIQSLRLPGVTVQPKGIDTIDCTGLADISERRSSPVTVAAKMPHIALKCEATYGLKANRVLPNPDLAPSATRWAPIDKKPLVVCLGRLDPIKRPWLAIEAARRLPHVQFVFAGTVHVGNGPGVWSPSDLPTNVTLLGRVVGEQKQHLLQRAWLLMNTSIYEESPVSWLEAFMYAVPIVSTVNCGDMASQFGAYVGDHLGDGLEAVPHLVEATQRLIDPAARTLAGTAGQEMVRREHNDRSFLRSLRFLAEASGADRVREAITLA